ncbi:hypothetical protein [Kocuria sp. cx-455]|uniref:hypothetical protein n=1 Tax=Kocuria sp. cx-455 TaxID=2771377 RepID=UPI001CC26777|nr:hypothetical protein [Kocuria sp. cx-455]
MTNSQKAKKYGASSDTPGGADPRAARPARRGQHVHEMPNGALRAEPGKASSAAIVVGAALIIGIAIWAYYTFVVLPGFSAAAAGGMPVPEMQLNGVDQQYMTQFSRALGETGLADYTGVHATTGLFAPLLFALGMVLFFGLNTPERVLKWSFWLVALAYAVVFVVGNRTLEAAVATPEDASLVAAASGLVMARWALLAAVVVVALIVNIMIVRRKLNDFAEGKLPGQRPRD